MNAIQTNEGSVNITAFAKSSGSASYQKEELVRELKKRGRKADVPHIHALAARNFADSRGWLATLVTGKLPCGDYAHCFSVCTTTELHNAPDTFSGEYTSTGA